ncbi:histone-lysine N-methyltransferase SETMAR [Trichonephila clavipes]|nr:histone-lysine N-methyltransferase SETMAR [Trichonephila clavipes]
MSVSLEHFVSYHENSDDFLFQIVTRDESRRSTISLSKRRSGLLLLDDNARPHSATKTQNHIATLGWERLHHAPNSSDFAPRESPLFPALKKNFTARRFGSNAEVKQAVKRFFRTQNPEFFLEGFLKLIKRYGKCLNVLGTYVET